MNRNIDLIIVIGMATLIAFSIVYIAIVGDIANQCHDRYLYDSIKQANCRDSNMPLHIWKIQP